MIATHDGRPARVGARETAAEDRPWRGRRVRGAGLVTALPATFLGVLLVQGLHAAPAGESPAAPRADNEPDAAREDAASTQLAPAGSPTVTTAAGLAPGSVLATAGLIDAGALTRLSGEARFPVEVEAPAAVTVGPDPELTGAPSAVASGDDVSLTLGGTTELILPLPTEEDAAVGEEPTIPGDDSFTGNNGGDFAGSELSDQIQGGAGDDVIRARGGHDNVLGEDGADQLYGEAGDDTLAGGRGDDLLDGGEGFDTTEGGPGDDRHVIDHLRDIATESQPGAAGGNDTLVVDDPWAESLAATWPRTAGDGRATFVLGTAEAADFGPELASWREQVHTEIENVRLRGDAGHDVLGDGRANVIEGDDGANRLLGRGGDDRLLGGAGDDWLEGGEGDDVLAGGDGDDWLAGGAGDDTYLLGLAEGPANIFDHEGRNTLRIEGADLGKLNGLEVGGNLEIGYDGQTIATLNDYASHKAAWAGIDVGQGVRPLDDILGLELTRQTAASEPDLLQEFLAPSDAAPVAARSSTASSDGLAAAAPAMGGNDSWLTGSADGGLDYGFPLGAAELEDALRAQERSG